ncbi:hypothetical protein RN001_002928 [Aquatica leii]|uniref:Cytochrome P450 n=1 Tax=Aquatica leii TaxID=1421715 RepID=A0AAN7Q922_9COLE|nr:hypothetical protein RN001_002928 [Aquatica leii]
MTVNTLPPEISHNSQLSTISVFYTLLIPALILWYVYWRISRKQLVELAEKLPGPKGWPIIGNALDLTGTPHGIVNITCHSFYKKIVFSEIFSRLYSHTHNFDNVMKIWVGPKLFIFLTDPRDVEVILSSHVHIDKSNEYRLFEPWLGNGLLISTGQKWRAHRKLIAPTFHLNVLKGFIDLFNANSRATVDKLHKLGDKTFDCHDYMSEATVEMLLETAMGVSKKTQDKSGFEYAMAVMKMCDILHARHTKLWLKPDWIFKLTKYGDIQEKLLDVIHSLTRKVVKSKMEAWNKGIRGSTAEVPDDIKSNQKKEETQAKTVVEGVSFGQSTGLKDDLDVEDNDIGEKKRLAFLDLMIEASQNGVVITSEEIKEQVDTIMFEGHDTTAAGSSFFLSLMASHPEIQERVIQEMDEIFGDSDRPATFADTLEMKYLERCLLETLRIFPPVPIIARQLRHNVKLASGDYMLPAGCTVIVATIRVHRRPDLYANPEQFNPDNFLPERTANRHYYGFIPFSAGPRSCVGRKYAMLKLKILLSTIMRNFRIRSDLTEKDFKLQSDIILKREEDNIGQEIDEFIKLGMFYGFGPIDWWWLGQQILMQTIKLSDDYTKDDNKRKTVTKYLYGKFLLENMNNESEAHDYLHEARHLATGKLWRVRELDIGQESVFKECCKLLYKILMAMGKKIAKSDPMQAIRLYAIAEKHAADACIIPEQVDAILLQGLCTMDTGNANSALLMFSKAIFFCNNLKLTEKLCETNIYFALAYVKVGKSDEAVKVLKKLLLEAEQNNLPFYVAQANKFIGEYYLNEGKPHMATPFLMKALEKFHELEDISNREQTKNLAAISAGQELLPKYVAVILKCNYGSGFENVFKINKWKDCREMFWDDGNLSSNDSGQSLIDFLAGRITMGKYKRTVGSRSYADFDPEVLRLAIEKRRKNGRPYRKLSKKYGISASTI